MGTEGEERHQSAAKQVSSRGVLLCCFFPQGTLGKYPQRPKFSTKYDFWVCSSMPIKILRNKSKSSALCSVATIQLACKHVKALKPDALPSKTTAKSKLWKNLPFTNMPYRMLSCSNSSHTSQGNALLSNVHLDNKVRSLVVLGLVIISQWKFWDVLQE